MPQPEATAGGAVVLIHGAWQGSWVWARLTPILEAAGLAPVAIDLPGNGMDDTPAEAVTLDLYVAHIAEIVSALPGPVALVGHSGGGLVATAAAEALTGKVNRVAYVAGMMLPSGMSFGDLLADMKAAEKGLVGIGPHLVWSPDGLTSAVPAEAAADIFLSDMARAEALELAAKLTPQPQGGRDIRTEWTKDRFGALLRLYVECAGDRSLALPVQRRMQELVPGATCITLDTGHAPQASAPERLAAALIPFLSR